MSFNVAAIEPNNDVMQATAIGLHNPLYASPTQMKDPSEALAKTGCI